MSTVYKRKFTFLDADRARFNIEAELTTRNGYLEFTMSGDHGQEVDSITPANEQQEELVTMWKTWHLNGMHAGTELQESVTKDIKGYDESLIALVTHKSDGTPMEAEHAALFRELWQKFLACATKPNKFNDPEANYFALMNEYGQNDFILLADKHIPVKDKCEKFFFSKETLLYDNDYRYGSKWLLRELPEDFQDDLDQLIDDIEEAEEDRKGDPLDDMSDEDLIALIEEKTSYSGSDAELFGALIRMFDLTENDFDDVDIESDNRVTVQGTDYLAGTDSEMDDKWDEDLENYIDECILPEVNENYRRYFDRESWKDDAKGDGRAHSLNRYDGGEESCEFNGTDYYAYRQG